MSDIFTPEYFEKHVTTVMPIVNVDLIIKNEDDDILLSWRNDEYFYGWHVPGRIVRFKNSLERTVRDCVELELDILSNSFTFKFLEFFETIREIEHRGHFITFAYETYMSKDIKSPYYHNLFPETNGYLEWFKECPENLIKEQNKYRKYFKNE